MIGRIAEPFSSPRMRLRQQQQLLKHERSFFLLQFFIHQKSNQGWFGRARTSLNINNDTADSAPFPELHFRFALRCQINREIQFSLPFVPFPSSRCFFEWFPSTASAAFSRSNQIFFRFTTRTSLCETDLFTISLSPPTTRLKSQLNCRRFRENSHWDVRFFDFFWSGLQSFL